jgi:peroxisome-assembly ATPase
MPYPDGPLHQLYYSLVKKDEVSADHHQLEALHYLERLREQLVHNPPPPIRPQLASTPATPTSDSSFGSWFYTAFGSASAADIPGRSWSSKGYSSIRGVYLHGGVGCGKTYLLNLFFDSIAHVPGWKDDCQRHHFHRFMLTVHQEMHKARYGGRSDGKGGATRQPGGGGRDAILPAVVDKIVRQGRLVYLDEFQGTATIRHSTVRARTMRCVPLYLLSSHSFGSVTDVADALILQRLFTGLWEHGAVVVATSNRPPDELYWNGIQRDRFLPFIELIKKRCDVVSMWDSVTDYRLVQKKLGASSTVYFVGTEARKEFDQLFFTLASGFPVAPTSLTTQGRQVPIPQAVVRRGLARFSFEDLCQKALGAADYLHIGQTFHTVFVEHVPALTINEINWVRRFITFVDAMYESKVKLIVQAATPPIEILSRPEGKKVHDELFAFDRTVSRLEEMQSQKYLQQRWAGSEPDRDADPMKPHARRVVPNLGDA